MSGIQFKTVIREAVALVTAIVVVLPLAAQAAQKCASGKNQTVGRG